MNTPLRRGALALAIAAAVSFTAFAAESRFEETRIDVRTKAGPVETVIVGAIAPGESRQITTILGNPAQVTRGEQALTLALAGETFEIPMPDPSANAEIATPDGRKIVRISKHVDESEIVSAEKHEKKVIVRHEGDADADVDLDDPG